MVKNTSIWLAGLSAAALISGAALAQTTPGQKMDEAGAHSGAAADQAGEALKDAASATGDAASNAASATGEAVQEGAAATGEAIQDGAAATAEVADEATDEMTTDTAEVEEGTPVEGQMFEQDEDTFLASTILGASIINTSGETVGDVNDLVVTSEGSVTGVVIGVGGFLGVGQKDVALEMQRVEISQDEDGDLVFTIAESEEALENAPAFVTAEEKQREMDRAASAASTPAPAAVPSQ